MIISLIASAVLGQAKSNEAWKQYQSNQKVQASKDRVAGLTGVHGENVAQPSMVDPMFQSLLTGAMVGQSMRKGTGSSDSNVTTADQPGGMAPRPGGTMSLAQAQNIGGGQSQGMNPYQQGYDQQFQQRYPFAVGS